MPNPPLCDPAHSHLEMKKPSSGCDRPCERVTRAAAPRYPRARRDVCARPHAPPPSCHARRESRSPVPSAARFRFSSSKDMPSKTEPRRHARTPGSSHRYRAQGGDQAPRATGRRRVQRHASVAKRAPPILRHHMLLSVVGPPGMRLTGWVRRFARALACTQTVLLG